jgi:HAD superfamily phosphatase (TIGR01668 family)
MIKKLIPDYYYKSIYAIPLSELYDKGIRLILTDLDNTLISYGKTDPRDELFDFKKKVLDLGFEFILVSNSRKKRVDHFANMYDIPYVKFSTKPLKRGIKKAIKKIAKEKYNNDQILLLGDQLMTDVLGGKRCKIKVCLIGPIDKRTDILSTRINRGIESFFLRRIKKKMRNEYDLKLKVFAGDEND